jgi:Leucine-rich repeat (LRR) protein
VKNKYLFFAIFLDSFFSFKSQGTLLKEVHLETIRDCSDKDLREAEALNIQSLNKWKILPFIFRKMENLRRLNLYKIDCAGDECDESCISRFGNCASTKITELMLDSADCFEIEKVNSFFKPFVTEGKLKKIMLSGFRAKYGCLLVGAEKKRFETGIEVLRRVGEINSLESLEFKFCSSVREEFEYHKLGFLNEIVEACVNLSGLKSLSFSRFSLDSMGKDKSLLVAKAIGSARGLKSLRISDDSLGCNFCVFEHLCSALGNCQELETLNFSYNGIFHSPVRNSKVLNVALKKLKNLRLLDLRRNFSSSFEGSEALGFALEGLPNLEVIIIFESEASDAVRAGLDSAGFYHGKTVDGDICRKEQIWFNKNYTDLSWAGDMSVDVFN